jgi:hypothetical protein
MAETHAISKGHPDMDYAEHEKTYRLFTGLLKWGAIAVAIILICLAFFLV